MIVLPVAAGTAVTLTAVWWVWRARRVWLYGQRPAAPRASITVTVVKPVQPPPAAPPAGPRVIRGEIER